MPSHAGRYTCSARNPAGVAHKHISLIVQGEHVFVKISFIEQQQNENKKEHLAFGNSYL